MGVVEQVEAIVKPLLVEHPEVFLYDVEHASGVLRIMVDRPGGINVDVIGELAQSISEALDVDDPLPNSRYLLEVTSPGIERKLRTAEHYRAQVGQTITLKTVVGVPGDRRVNATLLQADDDGIEIDAPIEDSPTRRLNYAEIESARTVFHWGEQTTSPGSKSAAKARTSKKGEAPATQNASKKRSVPKTSPASETSTTTTSTSTNKKASAT